MARREHVIGEPPERKEIRPLVEREPLHDLRRHQRWRSGDLRGHAERRERPEVEQPAVAVARESYVTRRKIAVHEPALMEQKQRRGDVAKIRASPSPGDGDELREVVPIEELHRVEWKA